MIEHRETMQQMRDNGMTYQQIGEHFNISRQRVHQLIGSSQKQRYMGKKNFFNIIANSGRWLTKRQIAKRLGYATPYLTITSLHWLESLIDENKVIKRYSQALDVWFYKAASDDDVLEG